MFIPVSLASGSTFVDCTVSVTGILNAACQVTYEGQTYPPSTDIPVEWGTTVRLTTTVTQYAEVPVVLNGKTFFWFVSLPKTLRYVDDLAYKRLTGTVYGKLYKYPSNEQIPYTVTGSFTAGDAVASVDYVKKEIWFFNTLDEVKKLTVADKPVAVVFAPRWSLAEGVETTCFVVTEAQIHRLSTTFDIVESWPLAAAPSCASADVNGNIVLCYAATNKIDVWQGGSVQHTNINATLAGAHSIFVTPDNNYIVGSTAGVVLVTLNAGTFAYEIMTSRVGLYFNFDLNADFLYAVDAANRCVVSIALSDRTYKAVYFDFVPRDVVVNGDDVYVSFLNQTKTLKYDKTLTTSVEFTTVKSYGSAFLDEFAVTDLYSNANDVTLAEPAAPEAVQTVELLVDEAYEHTWTVDWPRPEYVRLGTTEATVTVNEMAFTEGYLRAGDVVKVVMPASSDYYLSRYVKLIGRRVVSFNLRTEPKLFPNPVTLPQITGAMLRQEYEEIFEVTGLTDGFSVDVSTDSPDLVFSINGAAFAKTGTIENGDEVIAKVVLKTLITTRNGHAIVTEFDAPVSLWIVLVIELEGSVKADSQAKSQNRFPTMVYEPTFLPKHELPLPDVSNQPTMLSVDGYEPHAIQACTITVTGNDCTVLHDGSVSVQQLVGSATPSTTFSVQQLDGGVAPATMFSVQTFAAPVQSVTQFAEGVNASVLAQFSPALALIDANYEYGTSVAVVSSVMLHEVVEPHTWMESPFVYSRQTVQHVLEVEADYLKTPYAVTVSYSNEILRGVLSHTEAVSAVYDRTPQPHREVFEADQLFVHSPRRMQVAAQYDRFYRYPVSEVDMAYDRAIYGGQQHSPMPYVTGLHPNNVRIVVAMNAVMRPAITPYAISMPYAVRAPKGVLVDAPSFERVTSNRVVVDLPTSMFVRNTHAETLMAGAESGFFDTQAEAEAYALTLNLDVATPAQFFQIGGKWVFVSTPLADNAVCIPTALPPDQQKRFGYVGGG